MHFKNVYQTAFGYFFNSLVLQFSITRNHNSLWNLAEKAKFEKIIFSISYNRWSISSTVIPLNAVLSSSIVQTPNGNSPSKFVPSMTVPSGVDKDHNRVADSLDHQVSVQCKFIYSFLQLHTKEKSSWQAVQKSN
jgi:hypothetical protein